MDLALQIGRRTVKVLIGSVILVIVACFLWILISGFIRYRQNTHTVEVLSSARQFHMAMQQRVLDGVSTDDPSLGYPADIHMVSAKEYLDRYAGAYLTSDDVKQFEKYFLFGNVSQKDPAETIVLKSKPGVISGGGCIIFRKAGDGAILQARQTANIPGEPPRSPAYLSE